VLFFINKIFLNVHVTGLTNPQNLSFDSYLVNHSEAYGLAALASWLEFALEQLLIASWKHQLRSLTLFGLGCCIVGELVRKGV
jgi:protein-S-isoprenylcysteine O-methyltransferase